MALAINNWKCALILLLVCTASVKGKDEWTWGETLFWGLAGVGGGVAAVVAAPVVLTAAGFTSAGIAAGSIASTMMSTAAVINGGGVAAGGAVAVLQSAGAAGVGVVANTVLAATGAKAATKVYETIKDD